MSSNNALLANVLHLVNQSPGVHLRQLQRRLGISFSATRYNVEKLCKYGKIVCKKDRGHVRLYPLGTTEFEIAVYSQLRSHSGKAILDSLSKMKTSTNKGLALDTGLAKSTVSQKIQKLIQLGLVNINLDEDMKRTFALAPNLNISLLMADASSKPYSTTDRFIDLWDF